MAVILNEVKDLSQARASHRVLSVIVSSIVRLNSFVSRLSRRYPRGFAVHVACPTRSIPRSARN